MAVAIASRGVQHSLTSRSSAAVLPVQARLAHRTRPGSLSRRSLQVSCKSKKQSKKDDDKEFIRIKIGGLDLSVSEKTIWSVAVPAAGFLVLASLIGPLIIAIAASALAVGAALSAGAVAAAMFFPLFALVGMTMLTMGGLTFGTVAAVGMGMVLPKIITMVVAVSGIALGWVAVNFLSAQSKAAAGSSSTSGFSPADDDSDDEDPLIRELEEKERQMARELKDFDSVLAERERERRREEWRKGRGL